MNQPSVHPRIGGFRAELESDLIDSACSPGFHGCGRGHQGRIQTKRQPGAEAAPRLERHSWTGRRPEPQSVVRHGPKLLDRTQVERKDGPQHRIEDRNEEHFVGSPIEKCERRLRERLRSAGSGDGLDR